METDHAGQEIAQLRQEVARLRQQVTELRQFFSIERLDEIPGKPAIAHLHCSGLTLIDSSNPGRVQARLFGGSNGPCFTLQGEDEQTRLMLKVDQHGPHCQLLGKDFKSAVDIGAEESPARGQVAVLEDGKPRAVLKAASTGGAVSVMHDDNFPRALLHANAECGEIVAVNQDLKTSVKITSDGLNGGLLTVHGINGKPLVAVMGTDPAGIVMVKDKKGNVLGTLPELET